VIRNRDIPAEANRRDMRFAWLALLIVVPLMAFLIARPVLSPKDPVPAGTVGIVESQSWVSSKWARGGAVQRVRVKLPDGRVIDTVGGASPPVADGERVVVRSTLRGAFPYEVVREARETAK
jgi:hypothetical protein